VDVDSNVPDAMTVAIGDIDGVRTVRDVPLSELTGYKELSDPGARARRQGDGPTRSRRLDNM